MKKLKEMRKLSIAFVCAVCIAIAGLSEIAAKQIATQQVSIGCGMMSDGGKNGGWAAAAGISGACAVNVASGGKFLCWNPIGCKMFAVAGCLAL